MFNKIDRSQKVVNLNADTSIHNKANWIDYTELPDSGKVQTGNVEIKTENIGLFTEDELVAKGYQLTDTGWVKV